MKKIRMIVSAFVVFAAVGGALAFSPAQFAYFCNSSNQCQKLSPNPVFSTGSLRANAVTTAIIAGTPCDENCPESASIPYSIEN